MSGYTSETSLELPACFACNRRLNVKYVTCENRSCARFGPANNVSYCQVCIRGAVCACGTAFDANSARSVLERVICSTYVTTALGSGEEVDWGLEDEPCSQRVQMHYCRQCRGEAMQVRRDECGRVYCSYCWECWDGRILQEARQIAREFPWPKIEYYSNINRLEIGCDPPTQVQRDQARVPQVQVVHEDALWVAHQYLDADPVVPLGNPEWQILCLFLNR